MQDIVRVCLPGVAARSRSASAERGEESLLWVPELSASSIQLSGNTSLRRPTRLLSAPHTGQQLRRFVCVCVCVCVQISMSVYARVCEQRPLLHWNGFVRMWDSGWDRMRAGLINENVESQSRFFFFFFLHDRATFHWGGREWGVPQFGHGASIQPDRQRQAHHPHRGEGIYTQTHTQTNKHTHTDRQTNTHTHTPCSTYQVG